MKYQGAINRIIANDANFMAADLNHTTDKDRQGDQSWPNCIKLASGAETTFYYPQRFTDFFESLPRCTDMELTQDKSRD